MKSFRKVLIAAVIGFIFLLVLFNLTYEKVVMNQHKQRYIVMNRLNAVIEKELWQGTFYGDVWEKEREAFITEYGEENVPDSMEFISLNRLEQNQLSGMETNLESYIWNVYGEDDSLIGFIQYQYADEFTAGSRRIMNAALIACFFSVMGIWLYVNNKILKPFHHFVEFPEKLSKGITNEKLPETKSKYFGKFVWGMNMLTDYLAANKKKIQKLEYERQTLLTSIAHGVKTPVANIKLYANAIETGLYQAGKQVNQKDAEIAGKIEKNAADIETLVSEMLVAASTALCDFEPNPKVFHIRELAEMIEQEYGNRLQMHRIPYQVDCIGNPVINSDQDGLFHILSQLLENAIKYGDGTGITIALEKQEDGYYFSVKNKGALLPEREMPYIFKSFWRGSNAGKEEGCGIGLFVAKEMAKKLGGDIYVKGWEDTGEMEFIIFIENHFFS